MRHGSVIRACAMAAAQALVSAIAETAFAQACAPVEQAALTSPAPSPFDEFGRSVSISGDTAIVGEEYPSSGTAYVYVRSGSSWVQQGQLMPPDGSFGDSFGRSVAISDDTALVGAYGDDHPGLNDAGSAYVFVRSGSVWTQQAKLTAADAAANDNFGYAVALSGDTAIIGSWLDSHGGGSNAGSAYVFTRSGTVWTFQAKLIAIDAAADDIFGASTVVSGDIALISAIGDDHAGGIDAGSAYIFERTGPIWNQQAKLTASDAAANDGFGWSAALAENTAVIGARHDDHAAGANAGSAYIFSRVGTTWPQQQKLIAADTAGDDRFGSSVALTGDTIAVGASTDDHAGGVDAGSVYIFTRCGGVWTQQANLTGSDAGSSAYFGTDAALFADTVIVGAPAISFGSAYVFNLNCLGAADGGCCVNGVCAIMRESSCQAIGGVFLGVGVTCEDSKCDAVCPADIDGNDLVNVDDLLFLINAWGSCP